MAKKIKLQGKQYEWSEIKVTLFGVEIKGITQITYTTKCVSIGIIIKSQLYLESVESKN
jgi:hypothetical protein